MSDISDTVRAELSPGARPLPAEDAGVAVELLVDPFLAQTALVLMESDTSRSMRTSRLNCSSQSLQLEALR